MKRESDAKAWMQSSFIESKDENEEAHTGHLERSLRTSGGVHLPGLQREGGREANRSH